MLVDIKVCGLVEKVFFSFAFDNFEEEIWNVEKEEHFKVLKNLFFQFFFIIFYEKQEKEELEKIELKFSYLEGEETVAKKIFLQLRLKQVLIINNFNNFFSNNNIKKNQDLLRQKLYFFEEINTQIVLFLNKIMDNCFYKKQNIEPFFKQILTNKNFSSFLKNLFNEYSKKKWIFKRSFFKFIF